MVSKTSDMKFVVHIFCFLSCRPHIIYEYLTRVRFADLPFKYNQ
jgi:hypothetical protein